MRISAIDFKANIRYVPYMFPFHRRDDMQVRTSDRQQTRPVSQLIQMIEDAADAVDWQPVESFRWLGRSALLQHARSRLAVIAPGNSG
jgi:hypothetical protein